MGKGRDMRRTAKHERNTNIIAKQSVKCLSLVPIRRREREKHSSKLHAEVPTFCLARLILEYMLLALKISCAKLTS